MGLFSFLFGCGNESSYYKKNGKWHYDGMVVDSQNEPASFTPIDEYFAKDARIAYYRGTPIFIGENGSDSASFQVLSKYYAKDKAMVFFCDTERDSKEYWSIKRTVIKKIRDADPASFRMMSDGYLARDKSHLFRREKIVPVQDIDSFVLLEHAFARDKLRGYYRETEIPGSDGPSFNVLDAHYAKDQSKIYYVDGFSIGGTIKGVRQDTFKVIEEGYAVDGDKAYYRGKLISKDDVASLQYLAMGYAKTSRQVFYYGQLLKNADAASFSMTERFNGNFDATDKNRQFSAGQAIKPVP
ncbi:DKNYY domain-containing protein [Undibacterium sp. Ji49W]|uniref:DKNYY domain-containing protein n=1 Tax=Undibacterium sp. Ji49W TaxID=3413040 RepID=UPI003BF3EAD0